MNHIVLSLIMWVNKAWKVQQNELQKSNNEIQQKIFFDVGLSSVLDPRGLQKELKQRKKNAVNCILCFGCKIINVDEKRRTR